MYLNTDENGLNLDSKRFHYTMFVFKIMISEIMSAFFTIYTGDIYSILTIIMFSYFFRNVEVGRKPPHLESISFLNSDSL